MIKIDPFSLIRKLPTQRLQNAALDKVMSVMIPFNRGLGFRITDFSPQGVQVVSKATRRRQNHVGTAHACALALLGEYPAGLVIAQHFAFDRYRLILGHLTMEYAKPGRGTLTATSRAPAQFPDVVDGEAWVDMETLIRNEKGERVALCRTRWQIKEWERTKSAEPAG